MSGGLPNMGIYRSMSRSLVYAPIKRQGLGINKLYTTHGLIDVRKLLNNIWRGAETWKFLQTSMEYNKIEMGIRGSIFKLDYNIFGHLCEDT